MKLEEKMFLTRFVKDKEPHIKIKDKDVCSKCAEKFCLTVCPAGNFTLEGETLIFSCDSCFECGTCRIACRKNNLEWNYPRGGFGVLYRCG